jgi:di/tricarboxylate transporter
VTLLVIFHLTIKEVYKAINWQVIFHCRAISMGNGEHGNRKTLAEQLFGLFGWGPIALLSILYFLSSLTEIITNSAAVLLAPIAISTADTLGLMQDRFYSP